MRKTIKVLFICTGNICRSPMAESVFRNLVENKGLSNYFEIASAATSSWELGEPVHPGTLKVLQNHGVPIDPRKRARQVSPDDYLYYDYVLAMDNFNLKYMPNLEKISLLTKYAPPGSPEEVPDPFYTRDFETVYGLVQASCTNFLSQILANEK